MKCSKCGRDAITFIRYNGTHLCSQHFKEYVERRVKKEIRKQKGRKRLDRIAVALSGGKDSSTTLLLIHKIFSKSAQIHAISVDEGIGGYRDKTLEVAKRLCRDLDVEHHIVSFKGSIGITMDEVSKREDEIGVCTYCGVFRRYLLNREARELSADVLVLGHNLDDFAQSVLMNFVNADLEKLARIAPHLRIQEGLVPRLLPLRLIPEKEVMLYAMLNNLELCLDRCPYAFSNRFIFRRIIYELEDLYPGTRHKIVKVYDQIKPYLYELFPSEGMKRCKLCGEPSSKEICKACELRMRLGLV
ncbi:MAG TPA: TIGR00269 family protein [Thermoplasmatales archaeon]|nr:TIGR00269 family protein [Thermoplasmatales archaeon]HEX17545.1 TIGR00269 family protein [Thermoplasmatales archaeon]